MESFPVVCLLFMCGLIYAYAEDAPFRAIKGEIGRSENVGLWTAGMYIAAHKYFGVDYRFQRPPVELIPRNQMFYRQFPMPPVAPEQSVKDLKKACESSATECINEVLEKAPESGSLQYIMTMSSDEPLHAPFKNESQMFVFRQTAMYYLCWHTMRKDKRMQYHDSKWWAADGGVSCLEHLNLVDEVKNKRSDLMAGAKPKQKHPKDASMEIEQARGKPRLIGKPAISDIRDKSFQEDPYICPLLWFCPDPCYGRETQGNYMESNFNSLGNPCASLNSKECKLKPYENENFNDLIKNKFNITCDCTSTTKGYEWDNLKGRCKDKDECKDWTHTCAQNKYCENTNGSFKCVCPEDDGKGKMDENCDVQALDDQNVDDAAHGGSNNKDKPMTGRQMPLSALGVADTRHLSYICMVLAVIHCFLASLGYL